VTGGSRPCERFPFRRSSTLGRCGRSVAGRRASPRAVLLSLSDIDRTSSAISVTRSLGPCGMQAHLSMSLPRARRLVFRGPRGLPRLACTRAQIRAAPFTLGVAPASGFDHLASRLPSCHHDARVPADLPRVHSPSALPAGCVHVISRLCLTRYVPPSGALTLLTVSSATNPAGLFHPARAHGVHPFRATSRRAESPLGAPCPPDVSTTDRTRHRLAPSAPAEPWFERSDTDTRSAGSRQSPPSGLCSLRRPGTSASRIRRCRARKLSWASSSPGAYRAWRARRFTSSGSHGLRIVAFRTEVRLTADERPFEACCHDGWRLSLEIRRPS